MGLRRLTSNAKFTVPYGHASLIENATQRASGGGLTKTRFPTPITLQSIASKEWSRAVTDSNAIAP
ncbi:MAG: hypothetical protein RIC14_09790 [Filomicrobium sp.]